MKRGMWWSWGVVCVFLALSLSLVISRYAFAVVYYDENGNMHTDSSNASCDSDRSKVISYLCASDGKNMSGPTRWNSFTLDNGNIVIDVNVGRDDAGIEGGGKSWHLYNMQADGPQCTGTSAMCTVPNGQTGCSCDVTAATIKSRCEEIGRARDEKIKYYVSLGWEAIRYGGASLNHATSHKQYGPMAIDNAATAWSSARYNDWGAKNIDFYGVGTVTELEQRLRNADVDTSGKVDVHLSFNSSQQLRGLSNNGIAIYDSGVGYYCISNDDLANSSPYGTGVRIEWGDSDDEYRSTGVNGDTKEERPGDNVMDKEVAVGDTLTYTAKYYVVSYDQPETLQYSIGHSTKGSYGNAVTVKYPTNGYSDGTNSNFEGNFDVSNTHGKGYVLNDGYGQPVFNNSPRMVKKNTIEITFNTAGTYEFCESVEAPSYHDPTTSTACVRVKVRGTSRSARSMVVDGDHTANEGYLYADTGVVSSFTKKLLQLQVSLGEERIIKFSHSAFSTKQNDKVKWAVSALSADTGGKYEIINRMSGAAIGSTPIGKEYNENISIKEPMENNSSIYGKHYIDLYTFKFNNPGTYTFCETSTIAGTKYTEVCVEVAVGPPPSGSDTILGKSNDTPWTKYGSSNKVDVNLGIKNINDVIAVSFSHLVVGDKKMTAQYGVSQSYSGNYEIVESNVNSLSNNLNLKHKTLLTGMAGVYYEDNRGASVYNEVVKIRLKEKGSYTFCQTLSINKPGNFGSRVTTACYTVEVTDDTPICEGEEGTSFVRSRAYNLTTGSSGEIVYAKPWDETSYAQVYNSGVQIYADKEVTEKGGHKDHGKVNGKTSFYPNGLGERNDNKLMKYVRSGWSNKFSVSWASGARDDDPEQARSFGYGTTGCHGASAKLDITPQHVGNEYVSSISTPSPTSAWRTVIEDENYTWNCKPGIDGDTGSKMCTHEDNGGGEELDRCPASLGSGWSLVKTGSGKHAYECQKTEKTTVSCWDGGCPYCAGTFNEPYCTTENITNIPRNATCDGTKIGNQCITKQTEYVGYCWSSGCNSCPSGYTGPTRNGSTGTCTKLNTASAETYCSRKTGGEGYDRYHTCSHQGTAYIEFGISYGAEAESRVRVPYNYIIAPSIVAPDGPIYAGESMGNIKSVTATVNAKWNDVTNGSYATIAPGIKSQIIAFVADRDLSGSGATTAGSDLCSYATIGGKKSKQCAKLSENTSGQTLNSRGDLNGSAEGLNLATSGFYAFDTNAGDYICFAVGVYPHTSGESTNYTDAGGDHTWFLSNASCRIVAKRPTFQVHGGGLYSASSITVQKAAKVNLYPDYIANYNNIDRNNIGDAKLFTSWVEQNLVLKTDATTNTLASGNATAGGGKTKFCQYNAPLSFANFSTIAGAICNDATVFDGFVGKMGGAATAKIGVTKERANYVDYLLPDDATTAVAETDINLNDSSHYEKRDTDNNSTLRYTLAKNNISLTGATITKGVTHVVKSTKNITIDGDLSYANTTYTSLSEIPKLIIYGNNIYINCNVRRIDAILIANNTIDTCYNATDKNSAGKLRNDALRSNQLVINGMTISNKLTLGRTYGAAPGNNSDVPGEIINYDSSAVLWSNFVSGAGESGKITTTYRHELAPRM